MKGKTRILTSPEYQRVLQDHKLLTFATVVDGHESHHQIDVLEYDTPEKVDARMREVLAQVANELSANGSRRRKQAINADIQAMVDAAVRGFDDDRRRLH